jgi:hypothetical protein
MILCASINHEKFELLRPNEGAKPGEFLYLENLTPSKTTATTEINSKKFKKAIENFKTDDNCISCYNGNKLRSLSGYIVVDSLKNSPIS